MAYRKGYDMVARREPRHVSATEARVHLGELLRAVERDGEIVIVEKGGKPLAAVIPMDEYRRLHRPRLSAEWWQRQDKLAASIQRNLNGRELPDVKDLINAGRE